MFWIVIVVLSIILVIMGQWINSQSFHMNPYYDPVDVLSVENINLHSYPPSMIDSVRILDGYRICLTKQNKLSENGIYVVKANKLIRSDDTRYPIQLQPSRLLWVRAGNKYGGILFISVDLNKSIEDHFYPITFAPVSVFLKK